MLPSKGLINVLHEVYSFIIINTYLSLVVVPLHIVPANSVVLQIDRVLCIFIWKTIDNSTSLMSSNMSLY